MPNIRLLDFSGGIMRTTSRFLQRDNQLSLSVNNHGDNIGSMTKRPGFIKAGDDFESDKNIDALGAGRTYLYGGSNNSGNTAGQLKYNDTVDPLGGTWTAVTGGTAIPTNVRYNFVAFPQANTLVVAGAKDNPTVAGDYMVTQVVNETTPGTAADATNAPRSRFIARFRDRIYHGNCYAAWPDGAAIKKQRVAYSRVPQAGILRYINTSGNGAVSTAPGATAIGSTSVTLDSATSFGAEGTFHLGTQRNISYTGKSSNDLTGIPNAGDGSIKKNQKVGAYATQDPYFDFFDVDAPITGMISNNDALYTWTATGMWRYTGDSLKKLFSIGCVSHWSIKNIDIFTLWYDGQTVWASGGGKPEDIGRPVYELLRQVSNPSATFAEAPDNDHYRLHVGTLEVDGITYRNCFLQYTISSNRWDIYSLTVYDKAANSTITSAASYNDGDKTRMFFGSSKGQVYRLSESYDRPSDIIYSDGNVEGEMYPIQWLVKTKKYDFGEPEEIKAVAAYTVYSTRSQGMDMKVSIDNSPFVNLGQPIKKPTERVSAHHDVGHTMQYEFSETSTYPAVSVEGFSANINLNSNLQS
jgi:hypothetical protein